MSKYIQKKKNVLETLSERFKVRISYYEVHNYFSVSRCFALLNLMFSFNREIT